MDSNKTTRQYSIFDEQQNLYVDFNRITPNRQKNLQSVSFEDLQNISDLSPYYSPLFGANIWQSGRTYYDQHKEAVKEYLETSGVTPDTVEIVLLDYGNVLFGNFEFSASVGQMLDVLDKTKSYNSYMIDKHGFYRLLLLQYQISARTTVNYYMNVRDNDVQAKRRYIDTIPTGAMRAIKWAINNQYISLSDFAGVPSEKVFYFFGRVTGYSEFNDYVQFYHLAKYVYLAKPEELKAITPPTPPKEQEKPNFVKIADDGCIVIERFLSETQKQFARDVETVIDTTKTEQEKEQAKEQIVEWKGNTNLSPTLSLNNTFLSIQSRGVYGVKDGEIKGGILPIKNFIEQFLTENNIKLPVSPYQIEQAIDGVNIMALDKQGVRPVDGYYTYHTNLSEFSRYCGLMDANQTTNKQLLQALRIIDYVAWLVVWRPKGPVAVRVLTVTEIAQNGDFTVKVTTEAMKGKPNLVTQQGYEKLRAETKGQPKAHFRNQILSKGHKEEETLIMECWDYQTRYDLAKERGDAELKAFLDEWTKRKSRCRKQLREWFEEYAANGAITYTFTETQDGKKTKRVYKWKKGKLLKPDENDFITDAEIIPDNPQEQEQEPTAATQ